MSVTYNTTLKNTRMTAVVSAIDNGGAGSLLFGDSSGFGGVNLLATITFDSTCGTVSGGVLTFNGTPLVDASAAETGTATQAEVEDGVGHVVISGLTVGTSGSDINLSSTSIVQGQSMTLTTASITHG
jgi:hypothetical protein